MWYIHVHMIRYEMLIMWLWVYGGLGGLPGLPKMVTKKVSLPSYHSMLVVQLFGWGKLG